MFLTTKNNSMICTLERIYNSYIGNIDKKQVNVMIHLMRD